MMRTLILITLLMAPFAVQAQTLEFGPGGFRVTPHGGGDCRELRAACSTRKNWAKPAWATANATGNFALAARAATIIIAGIGKRNEASVAAFSAPTLA